MSTSNDLVKIVNSFRTARYDWFGLSKNPNITWEYINNNPDISWQPSGVSENPNITWEVMESNPKYPWIWSYITSNPNITLEIVDNNPNSILKQKFGVVAEWPADISNRTSDTSHTIMSKNLHKADITFDMAEKLNLTSQSNVIMLLQNPYVLDNIDFNMLLQKTKKIFSTSRGGMDYFRYLSKNPSLTWEMIQTYPTASWDWDELSVHPNITWEIVLSHPKIDWNWRKIFRNPNVTWENIQSNKDFFKQLRNRTLKFEWCLFSGNPNLTYDIMKENPNISWNYRTISNNLFQKHPVLIRKKKNTYKKVLEMMSH